MTTSRKRASNAALRKAVPLLRERAGGRCEWCGSTLVGGGDPHHRQRRGGPDRDVLSNLLLLCRGCHNAVHANVSASQNNGWIVSLYRTPATVPVLYRSDWVHLTDDGEVLPVSTQEGTAHVQ